jgi:acetylornithine deacetylase/succinyl-diaminopimelate desuccinylase-like protein
MIICNHRRGMPFASPRGEGSERRMEGPLTMYHRLRDRAQYYRDDLASLTRELIKIPSYGLRQRALADRIEGYMRGELEYDLVFRDEAGNVVGVLVGGDEGLTVLLNSHMDTIEPANVMHWKYDPFSAHLDRGHIYGLGAADCKGGLASQAYAGHMLNESDMLLWGTVVVACTVGEEDGCCVGTRCLIEDTLPKLDIKPDIAILGEPTGLSLCNGHDGWAVFDATVTGSDPFIVRRTSGLILKGLMDSSRHESARMGNPPMHIAEAKYQENNGALEATILICHRIGERESMDDILDRIKRRIQSLAGPYNDVQAGFDPRDGRQQRHAGIRVHIQCLTKPWKADLREPLLDWAREALATAGWKDARCHQRKTELPGMETSGSVLSDHYHIPVIGFGPGDECVAHAPDESIAVDRLVEAAYGTAVLVHSFVGGRLHGLLADRYAFNTGADETGKHRDVPLSS